MQSFHAKLLMFLIVLYSSNTININSIDDFLQLKVNS